MTDLNVRPLPNGTVRHPTDTLSAVSSGAAAGAVMGSLVEPGVGSLIGSLLGAAVGGLAALATHRR